MYLSKKSFTDLILYISLNSSSPPTHTLLSNTNIYNNISKYFRQDNDYKQDEKRESSRVIILIYSLLV